MHTSKKNKVFFLQKPTKLLINCVNNPSLVSYIAFFKSIEVLILVQNKSKLHVLKKLTSAGIVLLNKNLYSLLSVVQKTLRKTSTIL